MTAAPVPIPGPPIAGPEYPDYRNKLEAKPGCNSETKTNDVGPTCSGQEIFFDDFISSERINKKKWNYEVLMPLLPVRN